MIRTLYLCPDVGWPHQHLDCLWSLVEGERLVSSGRDVPKRWPQASEHVAILSPDQLVYHLVKLPPGVGWKDADAVAMALEDRLVDDLGRLVVAPLRVEGDDVVCCTVQRQRLEQLLTCMQELGRPLARVESLAEKLPATSDRWQIFQDEDGRLWFHDGITALELDTPVEDELPVALVLRRAQTLGPPPARVVLHGVAPALFKGLDAAWGVVVERMPAFDWRTTLQKRSRNLLVGDWVPRRKLLSEPAFKRAVIVIAACVLIQVLMAVVGLGKTWWSIHQVRAEQLAFWQELSGNADHTDQPARQLQQQWQAERARVGESRPGEFVPVLAALAQQLPRAQMVSLEYELGRLIVVWNGTAQDARALETGMQARGYTVVTQSSNGGVVTTALVARGNP